MERLNLNEVGLKLLHIRKSLSPGGKMMTRS